MPLALTAALGTDLVPPGLMVLAFASALLPDLDVLGLWLGIPYAHPFGHRGFTHSLPFSFALAVAGFLLAPAVDAQPAVAFWLVFASAASHGLLDGLTNGGLGVAFFSPFSHRRAFLPWRVIEVSPLRASSLFSRLGLRILASEIRWVWIPCSVIALAGLVLRVLVMRF